MMWNGGWGGGPWLIVPVLMCVGMVVMMLLMMGPGMRGHMHSHGSGHRSEASSDPALDTLRQRFAKGELTLQDYEERRRVLLTAADPSAENRRDDRGEIRY